MALDYILLDEDYQPSPEAQERIQKDIEWIGATFADSETPPILIVDGKEFEDSSSEFARVLGYEPPKQVIHYTTGVALGVFLLDRPLEELTEKDVDSIAKQTPLRLDMLLRLHKSAKQVAANQ